MSQVRNTYIGSILLDFPVKSDLLSGKDSDNEELLDGPVAKILQARFGKNIFWSLIFSIECFR